MTDDWFERSFREDYLLVYRHRDEASADREIANLLDHLPVRRAGRVLDLCCGSGRHSRALARRGYEVVGVDLSPVLLAVAQEKNTYDNLRFYQYDMREIPFDSEFDIVVNLFTSFGYFSSDEENARVVHNMARALKPGGEVVIDYLNPDYVKVHLIPESEREANGLFIKEQRWIEDGFVKKRILLYDAEQAEPRQYMEQVRLYHADEMQEMLQNAGFQSIQLFGDYDFSPYRKQDSPRMIFYAVRE
ncbi:class I SAM-dependent methyltransferase [Brevibacillus humidisoli]|uniref:class I SAM-dependent methyltransferase n=1 Tax=Brevibacillus humidisoli TaxID=2895522 RepID=UPI001E38D4B3|nr:class I SAM-dependent methyltransferase [Brevibacillus humidisoli]UFJ43078.1 class I SAM-dependent methyltransferase [Brevibacillus humidisoli]